MTRPRFEANRPTIGVMRRPRPARRRAPSRWTISLALLLASAHTAWARQPLAPEHPLAQGLTAAQAVALETIALQPEPLHPAIVEVAVNDHLVILLPTVWSDFEVSVQPLLAMYDEDERRALQDLMRYPGLLRDLVYDAENETDGDLDSRLAAYPERIRSVARTVATQHQPMLRSLVADVDAAVGGFERVIAGAPPETQQAFREVVAEPQLISLLVDHFGTTQQLGGAARVDRPGTLARLAELHALVLARQQEAEARAAMQRAAEEAARKAAAEREAQRAEQRRRRRLYYGRYPHWGSSACWYGDPAFDPYWHWGSSRCWYPWRGYGRRWW